MEIVMAIELCFNTAVVKNKIKLQVRCCGLKYLFLKGKRKRAALRMSYTSTAAGQRSFISE